MAQLARVYDNALDGAFDGAFDGEYVELPVTGTIVAPWGSAAAPTDSPARLLHQRLVESFEAHTSPEWKLPARIRLLIVTGAVLLPWTLIGLAFAF